MKTEDLLDNLSWDKPEITQKEAMELLININDDELIKLVQPNYKDCWQNAAIVLQQIGYPRVKGIIYALIKWLQDLNWPGALEINELLCTIPKEVLIIYVEEAIREALAEKDDMWLYWIKDLIICCKINKDDFMNIEYYDAIKDIEV